MKHLRDLIVDEAPEHIDMARCFCQVFEGNNKLKRYVFGRNNFAESISSTHAIDGFIDEFTDELTYLGKPVLRLDDIEPDALVVSAIIGRPLTANRKLADHGYRHIDYFSFRKYAKTKPVPARFEDCFRAEFFEHIEQYDEIFKRLADDVSKETFLKIVNFRLSSDITHLNGFTDQQSRQYFEDFLALSRSGETFADVGSFDGYTSEQFMLRCPDFREVLIFEPLETNMSEIRTRLACQPRIRYFPLGLSDRKASLRFTAAGSASRLNNDGELIVNVDCLDKIVAEPITFLKMDIEGAELAAIRGAQKLIRTYRPRLAVSVCHRVGDMREISSLILSYCSDYRIFLRHYTEGVDETVMFFIPSS